MSVRDDAIEAAVQADAEIEPERLFIEGGRERLERHVDAALAVVDARLRKRALTLLDWSKQWVDAGDTGEAVPIWLQGCAVHDAADLLASGDER